jgi:peptidoglycan/LPS O-acetylase OafA/YrhL
VNETIQRFALDPLLAALFLTLAIGGAWLLRLLLDRITTPGEAARGGSHRIASGTQKLVSLEGLRGILAFSVVAHHACAWYYFTQDGDWTGGSSIVFGRLASFGVIQFFYLSGFLFWRKLIQRGAMPAGRFYLSRFLRIGPVYYCCVATALILGFLIGGARLQVSIPNLFASLLPWLFFSIGGQPDVNHADILRITAGVTWTLALEWLFYLSLPFLAWFARKRWRLAVYALAFGALYLMARYLRDTTPDAAILSRVASEVAGYAKFMIVGFGGGMLIATTESWLRDKLGRIGSYANAIVLVLFAGYLIVPGIRDFGEILLLAGFALIVQGANLFGLLLSRPVRFMGAISYPVYLFHGIVFYAAMLLRGGIHPVSVPAYLAQTALCLAAILVLATAVHLLVERPTMRVSEQIARGAGGGKVKA